MSSDVLGEHVSRIVCGWLVSNRQMPAPPSALYLAAFTAHGEVSGGAYERVELPTGVAGTGFGSVFSIDGKSIRNAIDVVFPVATKTWGTVVSASLMDARVRGNTLLRFGGINVAIETNDQLKVQAGNLLAIIG